MSSIRDFFPCDSNVRVYCFKTIVAWTREMNDRLCDEIAKIPLFESLPAEHQRELGNIAVPKKYARGESVFSEGDAGNGFYVVARGRVKIFKLSFEGKEQILHVFGPGEPFGEVPVFEGRHFPAHAVALDDSMFLFFPRASFVNLIRGNPDLALNMLAVLSMRLRRLTTLVEDLSLKEVPARLAAHLLYVSETQGGSTQFKLDVAKGQLAGMLGTIPETLSRILARMTKQRLIGLDGPNVTILDRTGLEELTDGERRL